jgi:hypothetical protein
MKLEFWKLKVTAGVGNKIIGPHGMLSQFDQPNQFGYFSHLGPPYQQ